MSPSPEKYASVYLILFRWLDETPTARIITRCTQDIRAVDGPIPQAFSALTEIGMSMFSKIGVIIIFTPPFLVPGLAVAAFGFYIGNMYLKAQLSVKREMRYTRSHFLDSFLLIILLVMPVHLY